MVFEILFKNKGNKGKRKKLKFIRTMYFRLITVIIIFSIVPLFIMRGVILQNTKVKLRNDRIESIESHAYDLARLILRQKYFEGENTDSVEGQIDQLATIYDGRVIVVDEDYTVAKDSYNRMMTKKVISRDMLSCMNGIMVKEYDSSTDMIEVALPIINQDGKIHGAILISSSLADMTVTSTAISRMSLSIVIGFAVMLLILSLLIARTFTKPFKGVARSINRISDGYFDEEVNLTGFVEIEQISDAFNTMINKLRVLEDSRQEFVSNVSHELKTPITSIKVLADSLVMQEDAPAELYREFMQDIVEEIDRENTIINDLLSLVKMDKTAGELNISNININHMLELILKRLRPIAAKRNIELVFESFRTVTADCDEVKLTLAFSNLIENAIKYNIAGGWVQVSLDADHKNFHVRVSDSGIGIPEEYQDKIFERFYRIDKARSRETGGTGLGLAITRNIILMHKGTVRVKSSEEEGSTFTVKIPLNYIS